MQIAVFGRGFPTYARDNIAAMFRKFSELHVDLWIYEPLYSFLLEKADLHPETAGLFTDHESLPGDVDFLFSLGGDGTFLETVTLVRDSGIPVLGVNIGRLGFLSYISQETMNESLDSVFSGKFDIEERMMLQVETTNHSLEGLDVALNEVRVYKSSGSLITIHVRTEEELLSSYWADGLLLSTPTGSTAYNLSVGGPIVVPESHSIILSPIAPHNLTVRPLVLPDSAVLKLSVDTRDPHFQLALDSRTTDLTVDTGITVKKAGYTLKMVRIEKISFYSTLRNKLMWGADKRN
ncbi:MAG TPA: NAD kinase [Bacteroides sp.]|nr:NAD kinase [Bacteroides sp.]